MPKPYSLDLRSRVICCLDSGKKIKEVSRLFGVSTRSIHRWKRQYKASGALSPKPYVSKPCKITDYEALYKEVTRDKTVFQKDLAKQYGVSQSTISNTLKRAKITYKKNIFI